MKQSFTISCLLLFLNCANAQNNDKIIVGRRITIFSKLLNENRKVWIYTPKLTSQDTLTDKKYPVLYVLDGDAHFLSTVGVVQQLSQANGNGVLPEMIIVAIENTDRLKDFTPTVPTTNNAYAPNSFVSFLSSELIPFIDKTYNTTSYRLLVGHSLGGLVAIDILTNFPKLFNAYIAIEPSMWYDNEIFLNHTLSQLPKQDLKNISLFVGIANTMPKGMSVSKLKKDNSLDTKHIRAIFKLDKFLKSINNGLKYDHKYYDKDNHNSVSLISEYDGLRFIFDYYLLHATEKDFTDSSSTLALKLKTHYTKVSDRMGYKVSAPESFINYFGYEALSKNHYAKAKALFQLNIESYPNSNNVYKAYGDYFALQKDTINAIQNYKTALAIKTDAITESKLNSLSKQNSFYIPLKDLVKYAGIYHLEKYNIDIILEVRDNTLWSKVPGQADNELVAISKNQFTVKGKEGYIITFEMSEGKPVAFVSVQPNGTFKAIYKNK
jgi:hypothetical protein